MESYAKEKQLEQSVAAFNEPGQTTMEILSSIQSLMAFHDKNSQEYKHLQALGHAESSRILSGCVAINSSEILRQRLGTGWSAANAASRLMQARQAQKIYESAIDGTLELQPIQDAGFGQNALDLIAKTKLVNF